MKESIFNLPLTTYRLPLNLLSFLFNLLRTLQIAIADRAAEEKEKHNRPDNYERRDAQ